MKTAAAEVLKVIFIGIAHLFHAFGEWWGVIWRGLVYFLIPFLGILGERLARYAEADTWPSPISWVVMLIVGSGAGLIAVKAYMDGSAQRMGEIIKTRHDHDDFQTDFLTRQTIAANTQAAQAQSQLTPAKGINT